MARKSNNLLQVPLNTKWVKLKKRILTAEGDAKKFYLRRNKAAGQRLRKALREIRKLAKEAREETLELDKKM